MEMEEAQEHEDRTTDLSLHEITGRQKGEHSFYKRNWAGGKKQDHQGGDQTDPGMAHGERNHDGNQ